jgi:hypothetical protein
LEAYEVFASRLRVDSDSEEVCMPGSNMWPKLQPSQRSKASWFEAWPGEDQRSGEWDSNAEWQISKLRGKGKGDSSCSGEAACMWRASQRPEARIHKESGAW